MHGVIITRLQFRNVGKSELPRCPARVNVLTDVRPRTSLPGVATTSSKLKIRASSNSFSRTMRSSAAKCDIRTSAFGLAYLMASCGRERCSLFTSLCRPRKPLINLGPGRPFKNGTEQRWASGIRETIAVTASATSLVVSAPTPSACWKIRSTTAFSSLTVSAVGILGL
jgi:hypothetical protein